MLEGTLLLVCIDCVLALIWKFLTKFGNIIQFFIQIKFLQIINVEIDFIVKFCHFLIQMDVHSDLLLNLDLIHQLKYSGYYMI